MPAARSPWLRRVARCKAAVVCHRPSAIAARIFRRCCRALDGVGIGRLQGAGQVLGQGQEEGGRLVCGQPAARPEDGHRLPGRVLQHDLRAVLLKGQVPEQAGAQFHGIGAKSGGRSSVGGHGPGSGRWPFATGGGAKRGGSRGVCGSPVSCAWCRANAARSSSISARQPRHSPAGQLTSVKGSPSADSQMIVEARKSVAKGSALSR